MEQEQADVKKQQDRRDGIACLGYVLVGAPVAFALLCALWGVAGVAFNWMQTVWSF